MEFPGFRVEDLRFRVWDLGFRISGLGLRVWGLGFKVWGVGFAVWSSGSQSSQDLSTWDLRRKSNSGIGLAKIHEY